MTQFSRISIAVFTTMFLISCGGDDSSSSNTDSPVNLGPDLTVSTDSLTFSGKQYGELPPAQDIQLSYSTNVQIINFDQRFQNPNFDNGDIFTVSTNSNQSIATIRAISSDLEGGTYTDELVLTPLLRDGSQGKSVSVNLTLVQEPTTPITTDPEFSSVTIQDNGEPVRFKIMVGAGNTINWAVEPYSFQAENMDAVTSDPTEGTGSQEIDVIVTPTALLVDEARQGNNETYVEINFLDVDHVNNFGTLGITITLDE